MTDDIVEARPVKGTTWGVFVNDKLLSTHDREGARISAEQVRIWSES